MDIKQATINLDKIITNNEFARLQVNDHHIVRLIAVSKYSNSKEISTLYEAGQRAFGENKIQDLKIKSQELDHLPIQWHFIGRIQTNKINNLIDLNPVLVHSLDSIDLAIKLNEKLIIKNKTMKCLLQINSSNENSKQGFSPKDAIDAYSTIQNKCSNIILKGVMSIGAQSNDKNEIRNSFRITKKIFDNIPTASICSMGMSADYELAITCGSNMVRIGSSLFGNSNK